MNKELMQQALDALYNMVEDGDETDKQKAIAVIKSIEEAIAQPVQSSSEPAMTIGFDESEKCRSLPFGMKLYDHPAQPGDGPLKFNDAGQQTAYNYGYGHGKQESVQAQPVQPALLQDINRGLSKFLSNTPNARQEARDGVELIKKELND